MLQLLWENRANIGVAILILAALIAVMIRLRRKKGSCASCVGCPNASVCRKAEKGKTNK